MTTKTPTIRKFLPAIMAAVFGATLLALAQPAPTEKPENRPAPPRGGGFQDRPQAGAPRGDFAFFRVLSEDQRESFRDAMEAEGEKRRDLEMKLRDTRKDLMAASLEAKIDEAAVRKHALELGRLEGELALLRAKALAKVKPPLSAEQIEQIKNPPPFNPGEGFRPNPQRDFQDRPARPRAGPRDENDLPPKPKAEK